jgi:hypothetical protein
MKDSKIVYAKKKKEARLMNPQKTEKHRFASKFQVFFSI